MLKLGLVRANMEAKEEDRLPQREILGQIRFGILAFSQDIDMMTDPALSPHPSTFVFAGHDTTTNATTRILDQLAKRPDYQARLREEVTSARREHGDLDYDMLMSLPFLDAVCRETLRIYGPVSQLNRT